MRPGPALWRAALLAFMVMFAASPSGCVGCQGAEPEPRAAIALRLAFPEQASLVLDTKHAIAAVADGFALAAPESERPTLHRGFDALLPRAANGAVVFKVDGGLEISVREDGASTEEGVLAGDAVAYRRQ